MALVPQPTPRLNAAVVTASEKFVHRPHARAQQGNEVGTIHLAKPVAVNQSGEPLYDALVADTVLLERFEGATEEQRATVHIIFGPMTLDFNRLVGIRLGEHVLHTWDVEVALDPAAMLANDAANLILDNIHSVIQFTGRAKGEERTLSVRTTDPVREFSLPFNVDSVSLNDATHLGVVDLEIPAEAFVRLIYGRLDAEHTPSVVDAYEIESLRRAFPGV